MGALGPDEQTQVAAGLQVDPYTAAVTAEWVAEKISAEPTEVVVTIHDNLWRPIAECGNYIDLTCNDPRNRTPAGTITLPGAVPGGDGQPVENPLIPIVRNCRTILVPVTIEVGAVCWAGFVDSTNYTMENGLRTCRVNLLGIFDLLSYIFILPVWWLPLAVQPISHAVFFGNLVTVIESMIAEQAMRIQLGLWELVNNLLSLNFDLRTWFATWNLSNGNLFQMLTTPIYVVRTNPFGPGTGPFVAKTFRMTSLAAAIEEMTRAYGVDVDMRIWRPGDPQPDPWANLQVPTYVVRVRDRSGITGPTSTFLDGIIRQVVDLAGSTLGKVLAPIIEEAEGMQGVYISPAFGVHYLAPWAVLIDPGVGKRTPMESFTIDDHHPKGHTTIVGGKSPAWLNSLINALLSWLIDAITIIIGITGVPSTLLEGFLNDSFLAFQSLADYDQRVTVGPYGRPESFFPTQSAPYNVDTVFAFLQARWDGRGYRSATAMFRNGYPVSYGRDFAKGSLLSIAALGELTTDYVEDVVLVRNRKQGTKVMVQIGDGKAEEAPIVKHQRNITGLMELVNVLTIAPGGR